MTVSEPGPNEPVLDWRGLCCLDEDGEGLCNPITCACGPELHKTVAVLPGPDGDPDDSGTEPSVEIRARLDAVADVVRSSRGLEAGAPVPDVLQWTPEEVAAALPVMFPSQAVEEGSA